MNMSYCRFQNTRTDFRDCLNALREPDSVLSRDELDAAKALASDALEMLHLLAEQAGKQIEDIEDSDLDCALDEISAQAAEQNNEE